MDKYTIRKAEEKDIDEISKLDEICFTIPWSKESIEKEIKENKLALYLVVEVKNRIAGYAGLWMIVDEGHITNVAVHPDCRKKGIGESLVLEIFKETRKQGIKSYTLEVRFSNFAAIHLYEKLGFRKAGIRKKYYEDNGEDAIIMWRNE
ncbi:ribosomal protein S18-alanine N-acetyltransferase [Anaerovorax odorimutans]|uniref:ribosomal protein S18-alanine N-acetyltransferase n=1 Tax=Anaerovorax odorimutans TaxID=109327 RepID=UPI000405D9C8|nr:ribosomal protein S18-alanine N-acetyltransferase [Anaerovorax odorimutans]